MWRNAKGLPDFLALATGPQIATFLQKPLPALARSRHDQTIHVRTHLRTSRRLAGTPMPAPEATARQHIDRPLTESGWAVLDIADANLDASRGVSIREFPLTFGHGFADYVLFVDGRPADVIEAKKAGTTLTGVELQAAKYSAGFPDAFPAHYRPLPLLYRCTGLETCFKKGFAVSSFVFFQSAPFGHGSSSSSD
jgi:type I site-specific restriction endonuclease